MNVENSSMIEEDWEYQDVEIGDVESLLSEYDIEVESPDGFVPITKFVNKGKKRIYEITNNKDSSKIVKCSGNHLFYTDKGWKTVNELYSSLLDFKILMDTGKYETFEIRDTFTVEDVVDITVKHDKHRYYTNGFVSHNTNMGKSLIMASLAVSNVLQNKNVLYISCELSEDKTAERVLANLFDMPIGQIGFLSKDNFHQKYDKLQSTFHDKFVIKEYPSKSINTNAIRNLLKELKMKLKFEPDIIYLDQIENLNAIHKSKNDNSYNEMKRVTNEVRGLATEVGIPIVSAIQTNRDGFGSSELDLDNTGESIGFVQIADVVIGITQSDELRSAGKYSWRLLKNRYGINKRKISLCVDYERMRVYDDPDNDDGQSIGSEPPPNTQKQNETKTAAIEAVQGALNRSNKKKDNKVIEFE